MKKIKLSITIIATVFSASCKNSDTKKKESTSLATIDTIEHDLAMVPDDWIDARVTKSMQRLTSSDAGQIVWQAMEAHGGLSKWYRKGPLTFRFRYQPLDNGTPRDTYQIVDTWSNRARHYQANDSTSMYGWDGSQAWVKTTDSTTFDYNTRFWSLTPYFFLGQPFVLDGSGVLLELLESQEYQDGVCDVVKVSFEDGTGDAPDDYYILYFSQDSHLLQVIRYIVSYPGYFKDGEHLPEKFMKLVNLRKTEDFFLPQGYKTYWLNEKGGPGEHITNIDVTEIGFRPKTKDSIFKVPEGAKIQKGL